MIKTALLAALAALSLSGIVALLVLGKYDMLMWMGWSLVGVLVTAFAYIFISGLVMDLCGISESKKDLAVQVFGIIGALTGAALVAHFYSLYH